MPEEHLDFLSLWRLAEQAPNACALDDRARAPLTYSRLAALAQEAGAALADSGLAPGSVIAMAVPPGAEFLAAFIAITQSYACAPLDTGLTGAECRSHLQRIDTGTLLYAEGAGSTAAAAAAELGLRLIRLTPHGDHAGEFSLEVTQAGREDRAGRSTDAAVLMLTSATSDRPKLVPLTRDNLRISLQQNTRALGITAADGHLSLNPLCHAHGLLAALMQLSCGGRVCCASPFDPPGILAAIERFRPTWLTGSVPVLRMLLVLARQEPEIFRESPLRFLQSTGALPEPALMRQLEEATGVPVLSGYGMSEAGGVTRNTLDARREGSVGRGIGTEVAILDESGHPLPAGQEGEIAIRGPAVTAGYLDDDEANRASFRNGWFWTGDLGRFDADGFLYFAGRRKEIISRGGKKIIPQEVDSVLLRHPGVADAAAFAVPHPRLEQDLSAVVVRKAGTEVSETELRRFVAEHLAAYKVPRHIVFESEIPRTVTGKPKRAELSKAYADRAAIAAPDAGPATPEVEEVEARLRPVWTRILGVAEIRPHDNFFDLGGDSLAATLMLAQACEALAIPGKQLPEADFFETPTLRALAQTLTAGLHKVSEYPSVSNRILVHGPKTAQPPYFLFPASELDAYRYRHLAGCISPPQRFVVVCPGHPMRSGRLWNIEDLAREAVRTIREVQGKGPYTLGGYCFGGVVAFEAAAQLIELGERVSILALFETPAPGYPKVAKAWKNYGRAMGQVVRGLLKGKSIVTLQDVRAHAAALQDIAARRRPKAVPASAAGAPGIPPGHVSEMIAPAAATPELPPDAFHRALLAAYRPRPIPVRIVHFMGAGERVSTRILDDPRLGWRDFAAAGFEARRVAGDHGSVLAESNAPALATAMGTLPDS